MNAEYKALRNIFIQSSLTDAVLIQKVNSLGKDFMFAGEVRFDFWRYVFAKDITAKTLTNHLIKAGFDNLTVVEIVDALNSTRSIIKELLEDAKEHTK
jgi:hypothetical protein